MARVKLNFPDKKPIFIAQIPVRITDINYGSHLGNDVMVAIIHDARTQFLASHGFTELNAGGYGMIMADLMVSFKNEGFYGDLLQVEVFSDEITSRGFDLLYKITTQRAGALIEIAHGKTGMVCFDYQIKKVCTMPEILLERLSN